MVMRSTPAPRSSATDRAISDSPSISIRPFGRSFRNGRSRRPAPAARMTASRTLMRRTPSADVGGPRAAVVVEGVDFQPTLVDADRRDRVAAADDLLQQIGQLRR